MKQDITGVISKIAALANGTTKSAAPIESIAYNFLRPHLASMTTGAALGGIGGYVTEDPYKQNGAERAKHFAAIGALTGLGVSKYRVMSGRIKDLEAQVAAHAAGATP